MAEYLIKGETLTGIADAIREKTGGTDPVAVSDMAGKIAEIKAGGGNIDALIDRSITEISSSYAKTIGSSAFQSCSELTTVDFPVATSIGNYAFYSCSSLKSLLLRGNKVCTLAKNVFVSTPISSGTGYIYVPSSLIEQYKVATNWSTYAARFRALEDYTVDGTITGELDPAKTGT